MEYIIALLLLYLNPCIPLQKMLLDNGIMGGVKVGDDKLMFAVTEKRTKKEVDNLVALIVEFINNEGK